MNLFACIRKRCSRMVAIGACIILSGLGISLGTFCPYDQAWSYEDSVFLCPYANAAGKVGAYTASFLISLFGCAVWLLFPLVTLSIRFFSSSYSLSDKIQMLIGFVLMLGSTAGLCSYLGWDFFTGTVPGGALGDGICCLLRKFDDVFIEKLVLVFFLWVSFILVMGCSWISFKWPFYLLPDGFFCYWARCRCLNGSLLKWLRHKKLFRQTQIKVYSAQEDDNLEKVLEEVLDNFCEVPFAHDSQNSSS